MTLDNIKASIVNGCPVLTTMIDGKAALIVGYDDEKQRFRVRICGGKKTWVPYSSATDEHWVMTDEGIKEGEK